MSSSLSESTRLGPIVEVSLGPVSATEVTVSEVEHAAREPSTEKTSGGFTVEQGLSTGRRSGKATSSSGNPQHHQKTGDPQEQHQLADHSQ